MSDRYVVYDYDADLHKQWEQERKAKEARESLRTYNASRALQQPTYVFDSDIDRRIDNLLLQSKVVVNDTENNGF